MSIEYKILYQPNSILQVILSPHDSICSVGGSLHSYEGAIDLKTSLKQQSWIDYLAVLSSRKHLATNIFTASSPATINFIAPLGYSIHAQELTSSTFNFSPFNILAWYGNLQFQSIFNKKKLTAFLADELTFTNINGNGTLFFTVCGNIVERKLNQETIYINNGFLVGFEHGINCTPHTIGNLIKALLSEEGIMLCLTGTGKVLIQTRNPNLTS